MIKAKWGKWSSIILVNIGPEDEGSVALDITTRFVESPDTPSYASFARLTVEEAKKLRRELDDAIKAIEKDN